MLPSNNSLSSRISSPSFDSITGTNNLTCNGGCSFFSLSFSLSLSLFFLSQSKLSPGDNLQRRISKNWETRDRVAEVGLPGEIDVAWSNVA